MSSLGGSLGERALFLSAQGRFT
ncbi:hypothetical protein A2U01_0115319, partial [Trifolium medium]|nr:hypothetical protein [Trifolium medium]